MTEPSEAEVAEALASGRPVPPAAWRGELGRELASSARRRGLTGRPDALGAVVAVLALSGLLAFALGLLLT